MSRNTSPHVKHRAFDIEAAPTFYPTATEFMDPLKYIQQIRPLAQQFGICKIVPPADFKPPFCLDLDVVCVDVVSIPDSVSDVKYNGRDYEIFSALYGKNGIVLSTAKGRISNSCDGKQSCGLVSTEQSSQAVRRSQASTWI
jgi:hypothetical protein